MDETRELLKLTKEGDQDAREKIVLDNMGLIWSVVKRFTGRGTRARRSVSDWEHRTFKGRGTSLTSPMM